MRSKLAKKQNRIFEPPLWTLPDADYAPSCSGLEHPGLQSKQLSRDFLEDAQFDLQLVDPMWVYS